MLPRIRVSLLFILSSLLPAMTHAQDVADQESAVKTMDVKYTKMGENTVGYLAEPTGEGNRAAIVLIHEWWGLNDFIKATAREFAEQGYVALAVDLYDGESTSKSEKARGLATAVRSDMDGAFANLKDAIAYLKEKENVDPERMAAIGWCFGGGWSYQIAKNNLGVRASVIYYGQFNPEDDLKKMRAEIIGHFADKDRGIRVDKVNEFQAQLKTQGGNHEIYIYPNTTHGFASRPGENPNYVEPAAKTAWERTLGFLKKRL